jgi:putative SOS response-associated peptidase YedK
MPVILPEGVEDRWLDPGEGSRERLQALLTPYPAGEMAAFDVTPVVNSAGHDAPDCIAPAQS